MAYTATTTDFAASHPIYARVLEALKNFGAAYVEARSRQGEIAALEAMTDEELAERGLTRDGIVRHVFSDSYYL
ncbi:DUF1127 domain-containing protein [Maritimibacter sp. DP1N21-5]|uniref:DUF1127 domain-containing protein n=1 Tax=Maritimibacter sp. DP1N21-5 TaxID=2836867 RepID=UPI001C47DC5F|nr:DUF1127 domain-containing protein [Maritimibacter sp. DP1N21-5]MBV7408527.1 DUF1127 domain-containing protein [Maritimibacter sp. DP1N21-5]